MQLVECVPNFSEGRNRKILDAIAEAILSVNGVSLLDIDPGKSTNRTVMTFVAEPQDAVEAAFQAIARAASVIDMRNHRGAHPRIGATDVCPFVPVSGVSMAECAQLARQLGKRVGEELGIPVYLYGEAAQTPQRRNLADIRKGEYEGLPDRMRAGFTPDFGPVEFNPISGATVIGARPFLIAYNVNLNTSSQKLANEIALTIREAGRAARDEQGNVLKDQDGNTVKVAGTLRACKAVGWYIDEYRRAQVSINLVDHQITSLEDAFDECVKQAEHLGLRVTGSEIVGLVPLEPMLKAGRHYLKRQGRCIGVPDAQLIEIAVQSLGLSELSAFQPEEKIIEYRVEKERSGTRLLRNLRLRDFLDELSSESAAPGGGSVAALVASLSAALSAMVGNLTHAKKGMEDLRPLMDESASRAQCLKEELLRLVDEDTEAFKAIIEARRLPKSSEEDRSVREAAIARANERATLVPLAVLKQCLQTLELAELMGDKGNPNSLSDSGVAGLCARAAALGAYYNVLINLPSVADAALKESIKAEADSVMEIIEPRVERLHSRVLETLVGAL